MKGSVQISKYANLWFNEMYDFIGDVIEKDQYSRYTWSSNEKPMRVKRRESVFNNECRHDFLRMENWFKIAELYAMHIDLEIKYPIRSYFYIRNGVYE